MEAFLAWERLHEQRFEFDSVGHVVAERDVLRLTAFGIDPPLGAIYGGLVLAGED